HTRKNATLSRCAGFIFAWILKINPEKSGLSGEITPSVDFRGAGAGAMEINVLKNEYTPKGARALPKNKGVCFPAETSYHEKECPASSNISSSSEAAW